MKTSALIDVEAPANRDLLRRAALIAAELPDRSTTGDRDRIALAFGRDREAFAAALVACWLRGFGAAICENSLRERVQPVSEDPRSAMLLHDTDSGRHLQVPRLLADAALPAGPATWPDLPATAPVAVHVQDRTGARTWCSWSAEQLLAALDGLPAEPAGEQRRYTPGFLPALFWNVLRPLRAGTSMADRTPVSVRAQLAFAPEELPDTLPADALRDPNGEVLFAEHNLSQGRSRAGGSVTRALTFDCGVQTDGAATARVRIPDDYLFFEGHFEGYPVLAGGVQLHELLLPALRRLCAEVPAVTGLDGVKFASRIAPGADVRITLQPDEARTRVTFTFQDGEQRCTTGRVTFASPLPPFTNP